MGVGVAPPSQPSVSAGLRTTRPRVWVWRVFGKRSFVTLGAVSLAVLVQASAPVLSMISEPTSGKV